MQTGYGEKGKGPTGDAAGVARHHAYSFHGGHLRFLVAKPQDVNDPILVIAGVPLAEYLARSLSGLFRLTAVNPPSPLPNVGGSRCKVSPGQLGPLQYCN